MNKHSPSVPICLHLTDGNAAKPMPDAGCHRPDDVNGRFDRACMLLIVFCLLILIITVLVMAAVPPVSRDALTHHLAIPKLWIEKGGMVEIPNLDFSYYPMNLDLLYVIPMLFGNDILPKYIHFLFALATAWLIYAYLKQRTTRALSLGGALLFLSTPVIVKLSINVYVDLGLIFFSWASIFYLLTWHATHTQRKISFFQQYSVDWAWVPSIMGLSFCFCLCFLPPLFTFTMRFEINSRQNSRSVIRSSFF